MSLCCVFKNSIDAGVSIVSYRGWAYGIHGWQPPSFTSDSIPLLNNGWKLPVVMSFVCQNNDFANEEACFGEFSPAVKAGSAFRPPSRCSTRAKPGRAPPVRAVMISCVGVPLLQVWGGYDSAFASYAS